MRAVGEAEAYFGEVRTLVGMVHLSYELSCFKVIFNVVKGLDVSTHEAA